MTDVPASTSTSSTIAVGGSLTGTLETVGDHDWYKITLTAGQKIIISLGSSGATPVTDTFLNLRDSTGAVIASNDDGGPDTDSRIIFTVPTTGTYYIDAGAWNDMYSGTYALSVQTYTPPPTYSYDQIADQLTNDFWNGDYHRWAASQGGTITVNLTALTAAGQTLARAALAEWTDIIGINFQEVTTGGQMTFDDTEDGAFTNASWTNHIITSAQVNISTQWLTDYGTSLESYSFQTYLHEIGHALGLGHAGDYNGSATYPDDATFANDSWATTVMSYFSQTDSSYFADKGFTEDFVLTPMNGDIVAMQNLYGLSTTTRTGDTVYGFNSNANRQVFRASLYPDAAYTIYDSGGVDTLDYSGFGTNQLINLNAEQFMNVGSGVGNVMIARGVVIENAIGGSGSDSLIGNAANNRLLGLGGNDTLNGGAGADTMRGGLGNDSYFVDNSGDNPVENASEGTDAVSSSISFTLGANIENLTITGAAIRGTGNNLANTITGNSGANVLNGGLGGDAMSGAGGNDTYYVDNAGDTVVEASGAGRDRVYSTVSYTLGANSDDLFLRGSSAINATGNGLDNVLRGNSAANVLTGGAGADDFRGGTDSDTFVFNNGDFAGLTASTSDRIIDFNHAEADHINLAGVDANSISAGDQAFAFIGTAEFHHAAGELRYEIINSNTYLTGDTNGDGLADFMVRLDGAHALVSGDFVL